MSEHGQKLTEQEVEEAAYYADERYGEVLRWDEVMEIARTKKIPGHTPDNKKGVGGCEGADKEPSKVQLETSLLRNKPKVMGLCSGCAKSFDFCIGGSGKPRRKAAESGYWRHKGVFFL